jgi:hypothetical protein
MATRADQQAFGFAQTKYDDDGTPIGDLSRPGLTKREYFAAIAMQGLLAADMRGPIDEKPPSNFIAALAVDQADDLIAALNKDIPA